MQVSTITRHIKNYNFSEPTAVDHQPQYARSTCPLSPDTGVNYVVKHNTTRPNVKGLSSPEFYYCTKYCSKRALTTFTSLEKVGSTT